MFADIMKEEFVVNEPEEDLSEDIEIDEDVENNISSEDNIENLLFAEIE